MATANIPMRRRIIASVLARADEYEAKALAARTVPAIIFQDVQYGPWPMSEEERQYLFDRAHEMRQQAATLRGLWLGEWTV